MTARRRFEARIACMVGAALAALVWHDAAQAGTITLQPSATGADVGVNTNTANPTFTLSQGFPTLGSDVRGDGASTDSEAIYALSAISRGTTINSASLAVTATAWQGIAPFAANLTVYSYAETDGAVMLTDFSQPLTSAGTLTGLAGNSPSGGSLATTTINVTSLIQTLVNGGSAYVGFQFETVQGAVTINLPTLSITTALSTQAVPEPRSAWLLGLGLVGLLGFVTVRGR